MKHLKTLWATFYALMVSFAVLYPWNYAPAQSGGYGGWNMGPGMMGHGLVWNDYQDDILGSYYCGAGVPHQVAGSGHQRR